MRAADHCLCPFLAAMPSDHTLPDKVAERILVHAQARYNDAADYISGHIEHFCNPQLGIVILERELVMQEIVSSAAQRFSWKRLVCAMSSEEPTRSVT